MYERKRLCAVGRTSSESFGNATREEPLGLIWTACDGRVWRAPELHDGPVRRTLGQCAGLHDGLLWRVRGR